jgi:hypothetical protein
LISVDFIISISYGQKNSLYGQINSFCGQMNIIKSYGQINSFYGQMNSNLWTKKFAPFKISHMTFYIEYSSNKMAAFRNAFPMLFAILLFAIFLVQQHVVLVDGQQSCPTGGMQNKFLTFILINIMLSRMPRKSLVL